MTEWDWDPDAYLSTMLVEIPGYEELQEATAAATDGIEARSVLELGTGTGETALRVLARHPRASLVGVDASEAMLRRARERLPAADLRLGRLEEGLPPGPFDLVVSTLVVHHLDAAHKRDLFRRVAQVLRPGGRFVLADVVVPLPGEEGPIFIDWEMDVPDSAADQVAWLHEVGFEARAEYVRPDLAVLAGELPRAPVGANSRPRDKASTGLSSRSAVDDTSSSPAAAIHSRTGRDPI